MKFGRFLPGILLGTCLSVSVSLFAANPSPKDLLAAGRADEAVQTLHQQLARTPNDAVSQNLLCRAHFMLEEWDHAIAACERAVEIDPSKGLYHLWLGRAYGEKADRVGFLSAAGLAKKVRENFERAVELSPDNWEARTDLSEFYIEAPSIVGGGKDKARAQADALVPLNPAMAHWVNGRMAEKDKDQTGAEREYRAEIESSHGSARSWLDLALFFRHNNRVEEMEQALKTMESRPLDRPESLMDGASILLRAGRDFPLAVNLVKKYLASNTVEEGPVFKARCILGELLEKQGDRSGASEQFQAALALAPNYSRAREGSKRAGK
jgi:tetratricopeptide (TPR) repeat protein